MKLKDIRFNLRFSKGKDKNGEEQFDIIRSLQDLKDNLNLDDLYLYFISGQLSRWLICIGEPDRGEAIAKIDKTSPVKAQLNGIFEALGIDLSKNDLTSMIESYTYFKQLEDRKREMVAILNNVQNVIEQDYMQYHQCLKDIIAVNDDFAAVKSRVRALLKTYPQQFKLDWMRFYDMMLEKCPLAIFVVLMDPIYRKYYLGAPNEINARYYGELEIPFHQNFTNPLEDIISATTSQIAASISLVAQSLKTIGGGSETTSKDNVSKVSSSSVLQFIQRIENLLNVSYSYSEPKLRITLDAKQTLDINSWKEKNIIKEVDYSKSDGEWEDALDKDIKIMILHCGNNITIRPSGDKEHQLKGTQGVRFPIFNGLDFRTSTITPSSIEDILLYMEVE